MIEQSPNPPILALEDVRFGYPDRPDFLGSVSFAVDPGNLWGIIGPNAAGKSTLLRLIVGLLEPAGGVVRLNGQPMTKVSRRARARLIGFLPQQAAVSAFATAGEVVLMGRFPHRRYHVFESQEDLTAARAAMAAMDVLDFMDRPIATLSGGEAQRVYLAAALAQEPRLLVLDEPAAALDLYYQLDVFERLRRHAREERRSAIVVTHDLNLAGRYCDRLLLLSDGRAVASGAPEDVLRPDVLEAVYRVRFTTHRGQDGRQRWVLPCERVAEGAS